MASGVLLYNSPRGLVVIVKSKVSFPELKEWKIGHMLVFVATSH